MTTDRTTIILILMAGDQFTVTLMDSLVDEVQSGLDLWTSSTAPSVYCLYRRLEDDIGLQTYHYLLAPHTTATRVIQPEADLFDQIVEFFNGISSQMPQNGPIRVLLGAHGYAAIGFNPTFFFLFFWRLLQFVFSSFLSWLKELTWQERFQVLFYPSDNISRPLGGFTSRQNQLTLDLTLDQAAEALVSLPGSRLQTLILHTCQMSGVEVIHALKAVPHHIASESDMRNNCMSLSSWFPVLGNPTSTGANITEACFTSLATHASTNSLGKLVYDCQGFFSSHRTDTIDTVIQGLNHLGRVLSLLITTGPASEQERIIRLISGARSLSEITRTSTIDLGRFCFQLVARSVVASGDVDCILEGLAELQYSPVQITNGWDADVHKKLYCGVNIYFPSRSNRVRSTNDLPEQFKTEAADWCLFVNTWQFD